jgi:hypothetical protein
MKALFIGLLLFVGCFAPARAITEFCPARVTQMRDPSTTPPQKAFPTKDVENATARSTFAYTLDAQTPRTIVRATMIADTDDGWYGWSVENVPLAKTSVTEKDGRVALTFNFARSAPIVVTFPKAVVVHHAWVTQGRTAGENLVGWDSLGDFSCEVPDFPDGGPGFKAVARRQASTAQTPQPARNVPPGVATAVGQPFPMDCEVPFKRALVTRAKSPDYPVSAADFGSGYYVSLVEVAVGDDDRLIDAWVYAGSGNRAIDLSALTAARVSTYGSAVSYCQHVRGYYVFRADFIP